MRINIVCVGSIKEKFFVEAIEEYSKRLSRFCELKIIEVPEATKLTSLKQKCDQESELLLQKTKGTIICMDSKGKMLSSPEIADFMQKKKLFGENEFSFVIGGSNGLSENILSKASLVLSFGKITYPHQLFRVVLSEQIYRAVTIMEGLPYHK